MNREDQFINYLEGLKTDGNSELLESIASGFTSLLEYSVSGSSSEKLVDIMENVESSDVDVDVDDSFTDESVTDDDLLLESGDSSTLVNSLLSNKYLLTPSVLEGLGGSVILELLGMSSKLDSIDVEWDSELDRRFGLLADQAELNVTEFPITLNTLCSIGLREDIISTILSIVSCDSDSDSDSDSVALESTVDIKRRIYGSNSDAARNAIFHEKERAGVLSGIKRAGSNLGASIEMFNRQQESYGKPRLTEDTDISLEDDIMLEVGEGSIKGTLTPDLFNRLSSEIDLIEQKQRKLAYSSPYKQSFKNDGERESYINSIIAQNWRDKLLDLNVNPASVKGLVPVSLESIHASNLLLLESVKSLSGLDAPTFDEDPIIPNALSVISKHPGAIKFTDRSSFDKLLSDQRYFSASYSHCFYSMDELYNFINRTTDSTSNANCVILKNTGKRLVAVWDDINSIGYIIPA